MKANKIKAFLLVGCIGLLIGGIFFLVHQPASATAADLRFQVHPQSDLVYAYGWNDGVELTLVVTNADGDVLTEITTTVSPAPWDPLVFVADFSLTGFDYQPGQILTATGDGLTKEFVIPNPTVAQIDILADTITGTGTPGARMLICATYPDQCFDRYATIDDSGNWMVDFTTATDPGDTPGSFDLVAGSKGWADEFDGMDETWADDWRVDAPYVYVNPTWDEVRALGMPLDTVLTLTISETGSIVFTSDPTPIIENPDYPGELSAAFDMKGFDVEAGQQLTTSSAEVSSTYTVTVFAITDIDVLSDTISGIATPGSQVTICANLTDSCALRHPITDGSGNWLADFHTPGAGGDEQEIVDLHAGSNGWGNESDFMFNQTWSAWSVPNPSFQARANTDDVYAWEWMIGEELTLHVGGLEITGTVTAAPWDPDLSYLPFYLSGVYDIKPGDVITLTNGILTKTTTLTNLEIVGFDVDHDIVLGKAAPGSKVDLWACDLNNCTNVYRHVTADADGNWMADFSVPGSLPDEQATFDLIPGTWVDSQQLDDDGDATMFGEFIPHMVFLPSVSR